MSRHRVYPAGIVAGISAVVLIAASCNWPGISIPTNDCMPAAYHQTASNALTAYCRNPDGGSASQRRAALVADLAASAEVGSAGLAADGYTAWVRFADGTAAAINTREDFGTAAQITAVRTASPVQVGTPTASVRTAAVPGARTAANPQHLHVPISRKILMMSAAAERYRGWDRRAFESLRTALMTDNGWEAGDFTIMRNMAADDYATLAFNDLFDMGDYGVIVCIADTLLLDPSVYGVAPKPGPEPEYLYLQLAAADPYFDPDGSLKNRYDPLTGLDLQQELADVRLLRNLHVTPGGISRWYLYIREDLLHEQMTSLPNSLVYLAGPHTVSLAPVLGLVGAGSSLLWEGEVDTSRALDALHVLQDMARDSSSIADAAAGLSYGPDVSLEVFQRWVDGALYLPSWACCQTRNCPDTTVSTAVEISYTDPDVPLPAFPRVEDVPHVGHEIVDLIPTQEATITAQAIDAYEDVLDEVDTTLTLNAGSNTVIIYLSQYVLTLTVVSDTVAPGSTANLTATCMSLAGKPMPDKEVTFTTTFGTLLGANPVTTDASGQASIQLYAATEGTADVRAVVAADDKSATRQIVFGDQPELRIWLTGSPDTSGTAYWGANEATHAYMGRGYRITAYRDDVACSSGTKIGQYGDTNRPLPICGQYPEGNVAGVEIRLVFRSTDAQEGMPAWIDPLYLHYFYTDGSSHKVESVPAHETTVEGEESSYTFALTP